MEILTIVSRMMNVFLVLLLSPLLFGVVNRTKALCAGRHGAPLLQLYYDIFKLFRKGAVYGSATSWLFIAGPLVSVSACVVAAMLLPFGHQSALISFEGDVVLLIYLLGLARFFTVIAALDTGSSFEGMGASREVQFAVFAEPSLFLALAALARLSGSSSLSEICGGSLSHAWLTHGPALALLLVALLIVYLAENSRIPVDDPNTHLELTMIHEVMVLDHGGVELAYILWAQAIKFWILGTLMVGIVAGGISQGLVLDHMLFVFGMVFLAIIVGGIESTLARLRLIKIPHFLITALALSVVAIVLSVRH